MDFEIDSVVGAVVDCDKSCRGNHLPVAAVGTQEAELHAAVGSKKVGFVAAGSAKAGMAVVVAGDKEKNLPQVAVGNIREQTVASVQDILEVELEDMSAVVDTLWVVERSSREPKYQEKRS